MGTSYNRNSSNGNYISNGSGITLGKYRFSRDKAITTKSTSKAYDFLNPTEDFVGIVECKGNIRHIPKKGEMKQDLDVIDCHVITAWQTREVEEETDTGLFLRKKDEQYEDKDVSLILNKTVLYSKFKKLQDELQSLEGKRIVIVGLGKRENYYDYYVATEEQARKDGVLQVLQ